MLIVLLAGRPYGRNIKRADKGKVIGIDQDDYAIERAVEKLSTYRNFIPVRSNFSRIDQILDELNIEKINGIIFDLGVSSFQLDIPERDFPIIMICPLI